MCRQVPACNATQAPQQSGVDHSSPVLENQYVPRKLPAAQDEAQVVSGAPASDVDVTPGLGSSGRTQPANEGTA